MYRDLKPAAFYVPRNLNPKRIPEGMRKYAAYFLNLLHWKWICWRSDANGFIRIKREYIERIIPRDIWPVLRDCLQAKNVVDLDPLWKPGSYSQGYRLAENYRESRRHICKNQLLNEKFHRVYNQQNRLLPVHRWLAEKLDILDFNYEKAKEIIATLTPDDDSSMNTSDYRLLLMECSKRISNGEMSLTVDRFGRFHSPITSLKK